MELTKEFYNENYRLLFNIARKMLADEDSAKDAVHDSFIKYYKADEIEKSKKIYFIIKILKNTCIDYLRRKRPTTDIESLVNIQEEQQYLHNYDKLLLEELITQAINNLTEKQRSIFKYKYESGLTYNEISKLTNLKTRLLMSNYYYAKKNIISFTKNLLSKNKPELAC